MPDRAVVLDDLANRSAQIRHGKSQSGRLEGREAVRFNIIDEMPGLGLPGLTVA